METNYNGHSKSSGIYQIRNLNNGRIYIGSAKEFKSRLTCHTKTLRKGTHHNKFLQNDWNKCGEDSFIFEVLEVVEGEQSERLLVEQTYLDTYHDKQDSCYNFKKEATASSRSCFSKTPEETLALITENSKAMWANEEWKKKRVDACRTEEFRKKQSEKQKRVSSNPENGNSALANKQRFADEEYKKRHSNVLKDAWARDDGSRREKASEAAKIVYEANKEALRAALVEKTSKTYVIKSPEGDLFEIKNLAKFLREHDLPYDGNAYGNILYRNLCGWRVVERK